MSDTPRNVQDSIYLHTGRSTLHLAGAIATALNVRAKMGDQEYTDLLLAGGAAFGSLRDSGWDLMFDADGKFIGVVT